MGEKRSLVDDHRFVFAAEVPDGDGRAFVAVQWTALEFTADDSFLAPLRKYVEQRAELVEVWLAFPEDLLPIYEQLRDTERMPGHEDGLERRYRFFAVNGRGELVEQWPAENDDSIEASSAVVADVLADGARQVFNDSEGLACATAGFHFTHPSRTHSQFFMRGGQAASRVQHAFYVAWMLIRQTTGLNEIATVWVDSASIAPAAYAFVELSRRLGLTTPYRVESFSGYDGLTAQLEPRPTDIVLISSSTSGGMGRKVERRKKLQSERLITLFYLGQPEWPDDAGTLLCDLTDRQAIASREAYESRVLPYETYEAEECQLCAQGSGQIRLAGDSFFPETGVIALRMPSILDRPYREQRSRAKEDYAKFDGSEYFEDLFGLGVITYDAGTGASPRGAGVSTRLTNLFTHDAAIPAREVLVSKLRAAVSDPDKLVAVLSLLDDDSRALAEFCARDLFGGDGVLVSEDYWHRWTREPVGSLDEVAEGGTVLVCGGVIASGRSLAAVSRELRKLTSTFHTIYFVAAAHPVSSSAWQTHVNTLSRTSSKESSKVEHVWRLPREQRHPGGGTPWSRERGVLDRVAGWLGSEDQHSTLVRHLEPRLLQLERPRDEYLFVDARSTGASTPISAINKKFALWPFEWSEHERHMSFGTVPTHAEVYATAAHLLYESRRLNQTIEPRVSTIRRHGYALDPAVFDRFNDPAIQAAILRAASPGELDYSSDPQASSSIAHLLWFVLTNLESEAGAAGYEFALSLCEGLDLEQEYGLRIDPRRLKDLVTDLEERYGQDLSELAATAPSLRVLLLYLRATLASPEN